MEGIEIQQNIPLASMTTMRVGGTAEYFASVSKTDQLHKLVRWARVNAMPYLVLGGGSNILISDAGVRGLVIHNRCRQVRIDALPYCEPEGGREAWLFAESGAATAGAARISVRSGLTGFEWAVSVPGTIGGAVVNNAGAHGGEVKDTLENTLVLTAESTGGDVVEYRVEELSYAYRTSSLKHRPLAEANAVDENTGTGLAVRKAGFDAVVLSANFRLQYSADETEPKARADQFLAHRRSTQPSEPSLGSMFMNPPDDYAGRLIEAVGMKALRIGGVQISPLHANFMINTGEATASDILALIRQVQAGVDAESGVRLVPEIQLVGEWN